MIILSANDWSAILSTSQNENIVRRSEAQHGKGQTTVLHAAECLRYGNFTRPHCGLFFRMNLPIIKNGGSRSVDVKILCGTWGDSKFENVPQVAPTACYA
jgi:hypothetical protein